MLIVMVIRIIMTIEAIVSKWEEIPGPSSQAAILLIVMMIRIIMKTEAMVSKWEKIPGPSLQAEDVDDDKHKSCVDHERVHGSICP